MVICYCNRTYSNSGFWREECSCKSSKSLQSGRVEGAVLTSANCSCGKKRIRAQKSRPHKEQEVYQNARVRRWPLDPFPCQMNDLFSYQMNALSSINTSLIYPVFHCSPSSVPSLRYPMTLFPRIWLCSLVGFQPGDEWSSALGVAPRPSPSPFPSSSLATERVDAALVPRPAAARYQW